MSRRRFAKLAVVAPAMIPSPRSEELKYAGGLTDIEGIRVGHHTSRKRPTGCTVVLVEKGAAAGVDVRGSAPGTRETKLLDPVNTVQKIHAVILSGGSAFGLDTASGVMRYLEERGIGFEMQAARVPIVPAAVLYDLQLGDSAIRPDRTSGYQACQNSGTGPIAEGNVGAGAGATVGKMFGRERAMKGGVGSAAIRLGPVVVAALAAVNAVGDVIDPRTGRILAGARSADGKTLPGIMEAIRRSRPPQLRQGESTTLAVVATNAAFDKAGMNKIAQMSHDGLARAVNPVHTPYDGDTVFALSTGEVEGENLGHIGALAAEVTAQAIVRGVLQARSLPGYPAARDLGKN